MAAKKARQSRRDKALDISDAGWDTLGIPEAGLDGDPIKAEQLFRRALEIDPDLADAYNGLGNILWDRERYAEAEAMYRTALEKARAELGGDGIHDYTWWGRYS
ncbi:MAG: tetratricopeptide repeat protein, partial [Terriglobia bacterium]